MKKTILLLAVLIGFVSYAGPVEQSKNVKTEEIAILQKEQQRKTAFGYCLRRGEFVEAQVQYNVTPNGLQPDIAYVQGQRIYLNGARFTPLNPNNEMAVKYNFTHYVSSSAGTIYVIIN